jgi:outer membrane biosynthesis protein TonB
MADGNDAIARFRERQRADLEKRPQRGGGVLGRPGPRAGAPRVEPLPPRRAPRPVDLDHMVGGYLLSLLLHLLVIAAWVLGLPDFLRNKPPEEVAVAVQMINMAEFTRATQRNPHPVEKAKIDVPPPPTPVEKPDPPKDEVAPPPPAPPPPSPQVAQATEPKPEPPPPPKPETKPEPPKPDLPKPETKPEPPKPETKPEPPKPETKPEPPKPPDKKPPDKTADPFDSLLKNLAKQNPVSDKTNAPPKPQKQVASAPASAQPDAPLGSQLSTSDKDRIASAVQPCWYDDPGARGNGTMTAKIRVWIDDSGTVQRTELVDTSQLGDPVWRAFAERAKRAPLNPQCSKLPIPPDKIEQMKVFTFTFTPQGVL